MKFRLPFMRKKSPKCVLLFVKYPEKGKVKTRLASVLGDEKTLGLYRNFVLDTLDALRGTDAQCRICYDPGSAKKEIKKWLGSGYEYIPQKGDDLGARMKNAFTEAFSSGCREVILVGSDIPDLTHGIIEKSFTALRTHDCVLGPALDGGYYLIGFRSDSFHPGVFDDITWSGPGVLTGTAGRLESAGKTVSLVSELNDIDTIYDLRKYFERARHTDGESSRTYRYLVGQ